MKSWIFVVVALIGGYYGYHALWGGAGAGAESEAGAERPAFRLTPEEPAGGPVAEGTEAKEPAAPGVSLEPTGTDAVPNAPLPPPIDPEARALERRRLDALAAGDAAKAREAEEALLAGYPASEPARVVLFERGKAHLAQFRLLGQNTEGLAAAQEARRLLTAGIEIAALDAASRATLRTTLAELAQAVLFSGRHVEGVDRLYTPKRGDTLGALCAKEFRGYGSNVGPGFICAVNKMRSPNDLRAGEPIKVPLGAASILVKKSEFRLYFLVGGSYVADFPVGLGKLGSTPVAEFVIEKKLKNPDWYPSPGVMIPYGDARNILGTRWLGFKNSPDYRGFGIHGTVDPASIGREESSGCVRMQAADVERLFDWVPEGTPVTILR